MSADAGWMTRRNLLAAGAGLAAIGFNRSAEAADADSTQMISQLAKFKLNMEKEAEAVQALKDMCAGVEAGEPGVLAYVCHRSAKNPDEVVFFEVYKNDQALKDHGKTPHMAKLRASFATLFRLPVEVVKLDRLGGFTR
jgi:quinol monooxygenase YgiN